MTDQPTTYPLDAAARALAANADRRRVVRTLAGGLLAAASSVFGARVADGRQRDPVQPVLPQPEQPPMATLGGQGCSRGSCGVGYLCNRGQCLQLDGYCGHERCPAGATCASHVPGPGGSTDPADLLYCRCPNGQVAQDGACVCPPDTGCSGIAAAGPADGPNGFLDAEYTTAGFCCAYPQTGMACSNSGPGKKDGFAICCIPGVDCPPDDAVPGQLCAMAGQTECCDMSCYGGDAWTNPGY
jgi:hypothetical protein